MATAKDPTLPKHERDELDTYALAFRAKGLQSVCEEVKCCRTKKCFDTKYINLFVKVREGSHSANVWTLIKARMVASGSILREGLAPQSNMEREIEKFLEHFKTLK